MSAIMMIVMMKCKVMMIMMMISMMLMMMLVMMKASVQAGRVIREFYKFNFLRKLGQPTNTACSHVSKYEEPITKLILLV